MCKQKQFFCMNLNNKTENEKYLIKEMNKTKV